MDKLLVLLGYAGACLFLYKAGFQSQENKVLRSLIDIIPLRFQKSSQNNIGYVYVDIEGGVVDNVDSNSESGLQSKKKSVSNWKVQLHKLQTSNLLTSETITLLDNIFKVSNLTYAKEQSELKIANVFSDKLKKITPYTTKTQQYDPNILFCYEKSSKDNPRYHLVSSCQDIFVNENTAYLNFVEIIKTLVAELKNALDNELITIYYQHKIQEEINKKMRLYY